MEALFRFDSGLGSGSFFSISNEIYTFFFGDDLHLSFKLLLNFTECIQKAVQFEREGEN